MILRDSDTDKHIAEADIATYKVVNKISDNKYESIFKKYVYEKDKVNDGFIRITGWELTIMVDEGFHSYKRLGDAKFDYYIRKMHNFPNAVIIKCIIPKGSTFYNGFQRIGANGSTIVADQYVSDKIIVKEKVKL